jgi:histidine kinase/DNA gyrase B/HSP90-like ATPase
MGEDLPIDLYGALKAFLGSYTEKPEDVLVIEALSNAIDAKAKNVFIKLKKMNGNFYMTVTDDGAGMTMEQFKNYHTVSLSSKQKGEGIGFAGVGAKIYLAAENGSEILTITNSNLNKIFTSRMYRIGKRIQYDSSLKLPVKEFIDEKEKREALKRSGTSYRVKLNEDGYYYLKNHLAEILQRWFSYAMIRKSPNIYVGDERIKPFTPGSSEKLLIKYKQETIACYFYYDCEAIPEEYKHIVYTVYGKKINNEPIDFEYQIVDSQRKKVCAIVDVSILAKNLITNKEGFEKNTEVNQIKTQIRKAFYDFLKKKGFIRDLEQQDNRESLFINALVRKLDILLQQKEFKILNPFLNEQTRPVILKQNDGDITISRTDTGQDILRGNNPVHPIGPTITIGPDPSSGFVRDYAGDHLGKEVEVKAKGLSVIQLPYPNDNREGWIDLGRGALIYNTAHPFAESNRSLYNLMRVVTSTLIKDATEKEPMDAKRGLEMQEHLLHAILL